ncbi:ANTAR domain-containing protein [Streptomyces sp. NPDC091272]|uniref:ANTAR domain-containing protein n=1 Tax=Streptomyces sp. NPDC091272 TaxID=3365981 RepID=UPI00380FC13D
MTASDIPEIPYAQVDFRLAEALASAALKLHETAGREETARAAVRLARDMVPGADHASLSVVERSGKVRTLATTLPQRCETACPDADDGGSPPVPGDELWETPVSRVADDAGGSALFLRLRGHQSRFSVLGLYAAKPHAFADEEPVRVGRLLAGYIGIALETADVQEQLQEAMQTRDVIGQATGLLMGRLNIDAVQAFDRLVRASQKGNVKLRDIASRIVDASATE